MAPAPQSNDSRTALDQAKELYKAGKYEDSRVAFNRVINLSVEANDSAEGFYGLGLIDFSRGDLKAATGNFRRCLQFDPINANACYFLGEISARQNLPNDAEGFYRKALELNSAHRGARQRLDALRGAVPPEVDPRLVAQADSGGGAHHRDPIADDSRRPSAEPPAPDGQRQPPPAGLVGGIYEYIRNDPSALAKQTIQLIDSLALSSTQRLSAFAGPIVVRTLAVFVVPYVLIALIKSLGRRARPTEFQTLVLLLIIAAVIVYLIVSLLVYILKVKTTRFTFDKGRLKVASGIFSRSERNIELYRVEDVSLSQTLANRLTGDGTIWLHASAGHGSDINQPITGIAKIDDLRILQDRLRNLVLLLRTGAWGKGVIY
jgi:membrane protein YdbS with pleckstrin-like domain